MAVDGVLNFGSPIGRATVADEVVGPNFTELWISIDDSKDYNKTVAQVQTIVDGYPGLYRDLLTYLTEQVPHGACDPFWPDHRDAGEFDPAAGDLQFLLCWKNHRSSGSERIESVCWVFDPKPLQSRPPFPNASTLGVLTLKPAVTKSIFIMQLFAGACAIGVAQESGVKWKKHNINPMSPFEAVGVADFNNDGKLDVFCGDSWYAAPDWEQHKVREVPRGTNPHYHEDFADATMDVNGDGHIDVVTCAYFSKSISWLEHPGDPKKPWTLHAIDQPGSMETGYLVDLFKNGKPVFLPNVGGQVLYYQLKTQKPNVEWKPRMLAPQGAGHGLGHGDVNADGRIDIITPQGWYEQPANADTDWTFHQEFQLGTASIEILGHDFDGDGDTDIVWGMGHDFGLYWLKQSSVDGKRTWTKEPLDTSFSQVHTLHLADFDGDGQMEFVTGKRIYAHESEAGATAEPCIYVFDYDRTTSKWTKSTVYLGEPAPAAPLDPEKRDALKDFRTGSAGTGLQMVVRDMDSDGDIDIVAPGKSGLYWFENLRIQR